MAVLYMYTIVQCIHKPRYNFKLNLFVNICFKPKNSSSKLYLLPMNIQLKMEVGILGLGKRPCKMFAIFSYAFYFGQLGVLQLQK